MNNTQNAALRVFSELTADQIRQACEITEPSSLITDSGSEMEVDPLDNGKLSFKEPESGDSIQIDPSNGSISEIISNEQAAENAEGEQADPFDPSGEELELYADDEEDAITDDEIADLSNNENESDEEAQGDDEEEVIVDKFYSEIDNSTYYVSNYGRCFSEDGELISAAIGSGINKELNKEENMEEENEKIVGSQTYYFSNYGRCFSEDGEEICVNPDDEDYDGLDVVDEGKGTDDDDLVEIVKDFSDPVTGKTYYFSADGRCFSEDGEEIDLSDEEDNEEGDGEGSEGEDEDEIVDHYTDEESGKTYYFSRCGRCFSEDGEEVGLGDEDEDEEAPADEEGNDEDEDEDEIVGAGQGEDGKTYYFSRCGRCFSEDGEEVEPEFVDGEQAPEDAKGEAAPAEDGEEAPAEGEAAPAEEGEEEIKQFSASKVANPNEVFKIY